LTTLACGEIVTSGGTTLTATGLGAYIARATGKAISTVAVLVHDPTKPLW
jgi:ABC-type anion transport system duplicated permease subunit